MKAPLFVSLVVCVAFASLAVAPVAAQSKIHFGAAAAYGSGGGFADSVAVADLRGNGKLDLIVANSCQSVDQAGYCNGYPAGEVAVLLGNGDGTFQQAVTYSTGAYYTQSVAVGDVNGDGIPDLVVANWCETLNGGGGCAGQVGAVSVLLGNGDGTFQPAMVYGAGGYYSYSVLVGNLGSNGRLALVVTNSVSPGGSSYGSAGVLFGNGDGTFQPAVSYDTGGDIAASVAIGDVNGDGIPDLAVANFCSIGGGCQAPGEVGVLLGNSDGTFQPAVVYSSGGWGAYSIALADLRGDGILDVVVANQADNAQGSRLRAGMDVLLGNGDGTFQPAVSYLAVGLGPGATYPTGGVNTIAAMDVNGDGIPDLVVVEECRSLRDYQYCLGAGQINVFLGNGDGTFQKPIVYSSGGYYGSGLAIADVNGDGRRDLVVTNAFASEYDYYNGSVAVLLNETSYTTKTALTSSLNPSQVNQAVTFTATISSTPPVPNGEVVTFYSGSAKIGTGTTANGVASLTTSFSKAGTYTIKASYPGDPFRKKSSGTVKQMVNQ